MSVGQAATDAKLSPDILPLLGATTAFERLAETLVNLTGGRAASLDHATQDLLRPLLKSWLDENLPLIVERLVREEIERVARRGR